MEQQQPKTDLSALFVPVIFANGEDDDLAGLLATFRDEAVLFGDRVYQPGEDVSVIQRSLRMSRRLRVLNPSEDAPTGLDETWVVVRQPVNSRFVTICDCSVFLDLKGVS